DLEKGRIGVDRRLSGSRRRPIAWLGVGGWLITGLIVAGACVFTRVAGDASRIELDRLDIFHVNGDAALASARAAAEQNRKLLVLEADDLAVQYAAVFQANRIGQSRKTYSQSQSECEQRLQQKLFHSHLH